MKREIPRLLGTTRKLSPAYAFEQANSAYDAGDYPQSLMLFEQARSSGLETEVVYNNRGAVLDALGRAREASESYRYAIHLSPGYELAWHNLGNCLYSLSVFDDAADCYEEASRLNPSRWQNLYGLTSAYIRLGKHRKARQPLIQLVSDAGDNVDALLAAAELNIDMESYEQAIELCERCLKIHPGSIDALTVMATAFHEKGEFLNAIQAFEAARRSAPNDKELLNNLGYTYFCSGQLAKALECFDRAIEIDPMYKPAWYNKGYSLHGADRLSQAVECYARAIEIDSDDRVLWNNMGNALYNLGRFTESIPKFIEAIRVDPGYEIAWNNIGNALEKVGLWEIAIPFHDRALELKPDFDYAMYAKGVCKSMTGHSEEGFELITASLDINPDYDEAWKALARAARDMGRIDEAIQAVDESLSVNPGFGDGWAEKGDLLTVAGDFEGARQAYMNALRSLPMRSRESQNEIASILTRVKVLSKMGMYHEALSVLEDSVLMGVRSPSVMISLLDVRCLLDEWVLPAEVGEIVRAVDNIDVQIALCRFFICGGRLASARDVLARIGASRPLSDDYIILDARLIAAEGGSDEAIALLVGQENPSHDMLRLLGEVAEHSGRFELAAESYSKALDRAPSDYMAAVSLARTLLLMKDYPRAMGASLVATGIDDDEPEPYELRAEVYTLLGKSEKARVAAAEAGIRSPANATEDDHGGMTDG